MCRIYVDYNSPLTDKKMKELLEFLVRENGGDGCGFMYGVEGADKLYSVKDKDWNNPQFMVNTIFKFRKEASTPVVLHMRKASVGTIVNTLNNHPVSLDRGTKWKKENKETYSAYAGSFLIHNGTVPEDRLRRWRRELILSGAFTVQELRRNLTDTKILAAIVSTFGHRMLSDNYTHFGLVLTMDMDGDIQIVKTSLRDLYAVVWSENSWIITSNLSLELAKEFSKEAIVVEIPSIYCNFNYILNTIEDRKIDESRLNKEFKSKNSTSGTGTYNYSYGVSGRYNNGGQGQNFKKGGKNKKGNALTNTKIDSMLKAKRFIVAENGAIEPHEVA